MEATTFDIRYQAMDAALSKKSLVDMQVISYPNMKKEDMRKFHKSMYEKAYPPHLQQKKVHSSKEAFNLFKEEISG